MKKKLTQRRSGTAVLFSLCILLIFACDNGLFIKNFNGIPAGMGEVRLYLEENNARTILPDIPEVTTFQSFRFLFTAIAGVNAKNAVLNRTLDEFSEPVNLEAGTYDLRVIAYLQPGQTDPAAWANYSNIIVIAGQGTNLSISFEPLPANGRIYSDDGNPGALGSKGVFSWNIDFPSYVTEASMNIKPLAATGTPEETYYFTGGNPSLSKTGVLQLNTGYYEVLFTFIKDGNTQRVEWLEVLHVYQNLVSYYGRAGSPHVFDDKYFNNIRHTVTFIFNDGTSAMQNVMHGDPIVANQPGWQTNRGYVPLTHEDDGFTFGGWYLDGVESAGPLPTVADYNNPRWQKSRRWEFDTTALSVSAMGTSGLDLVRVTRDITLYAKWVPKPRLNLPEYIDLIRYNTDPAYKLEIDDPDSEANFVLNFVDDTEATVEYGYQQDGKRPSPMNVTIINDWPGRARITNIRLREMNDDSNVLTLISNGGSITETSSNFNWTGSNLASTVISGNNQTNPYTNFRVQPKTGLDAGRYYAVIDITYEGVETDADDLTWSHTVTTAVLFNVDTRSITITGVTAVNRKYNQPAISSAVDLDGGILQNLVSGDAVGFNLGSGTMNDPNAGDDKPVTTAITLTGGKASNYTLVQPNNITVNIEKADGVAVNENDITGVTALPFSNTLGAQIRINAVTIATNPIPSDQQIVEYALTTTIGEPADPAGWQDRIAVTGTETFTVMDNTTYYIYARSKENDNYKAGTKVISASAPVTSDIDLNPGISGWIELTSPAYNGATLTGNYKVTGGGTRNLINLRVSGTATIYIEAGTTLSVTGSDGSGASPGRAGIELPAGSTLIVRGGGNLNAQGGHAANGTNGGTPDGRAYDGYWESGPLGQCGSRAAGRGGDGGGGAGAGIGTNGGAGGAGGAGGSAWGGNIGITRSNGTSGGNGSNGASSAPMGTLYILDTVSVTATGGGASSRGGAGFAERCSPIRRHNSRCNGVGGPGGGGGGGNGGAASGIGSGGAGGGGGGGGSTSGNVVGAATHKSIYIAMGVGGNGGGGVTSGGLRGIDGYREREAPWSSPYDPGYRPGDVIAYRYGSSANGGVTLGGKTQVRSQDGGSGIQVYSGYPGMGGDAGNKGGDGVVYRRSTATTVTNNGTNVASTTNPTSFTITYYPNGAPGTAQENYPFGLRGYNPHSPNQFVVFIADSNLFSRTGYNFEGWGASSGDSPVIYSALQRLFAVPTPNALYAQWTPKNFLVTLNQNNGTGGTATASVTYDSSAITPITNPSRNGYTFAGYATGTGATDPVVIDASGALVAGVSGWTNSSGQWARDAAGTITLYAKWTPRTYTVTLDQGSGSGGTVSVTATYGAAMPAITLPTQAGHAFMGYYDAATGGNQYYTATGASARTWDKDATGTTLYAQWVQVTVTINIHPAGAAGLTPGSNHSMTVSATGSPSGVGTLSYQWYRNNAIISGATGASYTATNLAAGTYTYYCVVSYTLNGVTATATSGTATVTVQNPQLTGTVDVTMIGGSIPLQFIATVSANSNGHGFGTFYYTWYQNGNLIQATSTNHIYLHSSLTGGTFTVVVTHSDCTGSISGNFN